MSPEYGIVLFLDLLISGFLIYLSVLDFRKHRISDRHTFGILLPLSLLRLLFAGWNSWKAGISVLAFLTHSLLGAAAAFGVFYGTAWALYRLEESRTGRPGKPGIGGGDIKLISVLGLAGGLSGLLVTVLTGFLIGIPAALINRFRGRRYTALAGFFSLGFLCYLILADLIPLFQ